MDSAGVMLPPEMLPSGGGDVVYCAYGKCHDVAFPCDRCITIKADPQSVFNILMSGVAATGKYPHMRVCKPKTAKMDAA